MHQREAWKRLTAVGFFADPSRPRPGDTRGGAPLSSCSWQTAAARPNKANPVPATQAAPARAAERARARAAEEALARAAELALARAAGLAQARAAEPPE